MSISDCGLMLEPQQGMTVDELVEWAKYAERAGYGHILRSDHLLPIVEEYMTESVAESVPECWVTLGALATATTRIKFGPLVSPVGFRNPAVIANMASSLHHFSRGRLMLGIGAGWFEQEYDALGIPFPPFTVRCEQFLEALQIIRPLTQGDEIDFRGKYFTAKTRCLPKPMKRVHLIVGGKHKTVIHAAADLADEWNSFASLQPVGFRKHVASIHQLSGGRTVDISVTGPFVLAETQDKLLLKLKQYARLGKILNSPLSANELRKQGVFCGTPNELAAQLDDFIQAGAKKFYFQILIKEDKTMVDLLTSTLKGW